VSLYCIILCYRRPNSLLLLPIPSHDRYLDHARSTPKSGSFNAGYRGHRIGDERVGSNGGQSGDNVADPSPNTASAVGYQALGESALADSRSQASSLSLTETMLQGDAYGGLNQRDIREANSRAASINSHSPLAAVSSSGYGQVKMRPVAKAAAAADRARKSAASAESAGYTHLSPVKMPSPKSAESSPSPRAERSASTRNDAFIPPQPTDPAPDLAAAVAGGGSHCAGEPPTDGAVSAQHDPVAYEALNSQSASQHLQPSAQFATDVVNMSIVSCVSEI
jgi:hypothetical protein